MKKNFRLLINMAFKTITPWKISVWEKTRTVSAQEYKEGWNDCLKEIKKNRKAWLKNYDEKVPDIKV